MFGAFKSIPLVIVVTIHYHTPNVQRLRGLIVHPDRDPALRTPYESTATQHPRVTSFRRAL